MKLHIKLFLFILAVVFSSCQEPLEKKYNPQTFSEDLEAISESDKMILINIINAYQKAGRSVNTIAGSEVVLIESLTYEQILENYSQFHSLWKETKKEELVNELSSLMYESVETPFLTDNLKVWILPETVKNPQNNYVSYRILYENQSNEPISFKSRLLGTIITLDKTLEISPNGYIPANDSKIEYIAAYRFQDHEIPKSRTPLALRLNDSDKFIYGTNEYSLNEAIFKGQMDEVLEEEKEIIIKEFEKEFEKETPRTFWPYSFDEKEKLLISKYHKAFIDVLEEVK